MPQALLAQIKCRVAEWHADRPRRRSVAPWILDLERAYGRPRGVPAPLHDVDRGSMHGIDVVTIHAHLFPVPAIARPMDFAWLDADTAGG
jgi:hypothetical protein